jgi:hypothetical protein
MPKVNLWIRKTFMNAKNKKVSPQKVNDPVNSELDWDTRKQNLEHRIKALRKIIEQLNEEGKDKK